MHARVRVQTFVQMRGHAREPVQALVQMLVPAQTPVLARTQVRAQALVQLLVPLQVQVQALVQMQVPVPVLAQPRAHSGVSPQRCATARLPTWPAGVRPPAQRAGPREWSLRPQHPAPMRSRVPEFAADAGRRTVPRHSPRRR
jgi:hypothetical protein